MLHYQRSVKNDENRWCRGGVERSVDNKMYSSDSTQSHPREHSWGSRRIIILSARLKLVAASNICMKDEIFIHFSRAAAVSKHNERNHARLNIEN